LFSISSDRMLEEIMTSHNTNCRSPWSTPFTFHILVSYHP
jgi:hypothetical protein